MERNICILELIKMYLNQSKHTSLQDAVYRPRICFWSDAGVTTMTFLIKRNTLEYESSVKIISSSWFCFLSYSCWSSLASSSVSFLFFLSSSLVSSLFHSFASSFGRKWSRLTGRYGLQSLPAKTMKRWRYCYAERSGCNFSRIRVQCSHTADKFGSLLFLLTGCLMGKCCSLLLTGDLWSVAFKERNVLDWYSLGGRGGDYPSSYWYPFN